MAWWTGKPFPVEEELAEFSRRDVHCINEAVDRLCRERLISRQSDGGLNVVGPVSRSDPKSGIASFGLDERREFAQALQRHLDWASNEALEVLYDDVVAKHLAAASDRLGSRFG